MPMYYGLCACSCVVRAFGVAGTSAGAMHLVLDGFVIIHVTEWIMDISGFRHKVPS